MRTVRSTLIAPKVVCSKQLSIFEIMIRWFVSLVRYISAFASNFVTAKLFEMNRTTNFFQLHRTFPLTACGIGIVA